jgi:predicted RNA-binding protein (virulence factor B family)
MLKPGFNYTLTITQKNSQGFILEAEGSSQQVLLPLQYADSGLLVGDKLTVFLYHDSLGVLCASTQKPKAEVGQLATLKVVDMNPSGAFLDWGLPKDLLLPRSLHEDDLQVGDYCLVKVLYDEPTGKVIAKEKLNDELSNEQLTVEEKEIVRCIVYKDTELGYQVIVNEKHIGLLHYNEVFKDLYVGDAFTGFVKSIKEDNKINIMIGKPGHQRVEDESSKILSLLKKHNGFLPYHDKSNADDIYRVFGMSKKTFKMTIGGLYREKKIVIEQDGIRLIPKNTR